MDSQQQLQLARVTTSIAPLVLDFCRQLAVVNGAREFRMADLTAYVAKRAHGRIAPDSPGRILRQLAKGALVRYRVVNRAQSLYELEWVKAA